MTVTATPEPDDGGLERERAILVEAWDRACESGDALSLMSVGQLIRLYNRLVAPDRRIVP